MHQQHYEHGGLGPRCETTAVNDQPTGAQDSNFAQGSH